MRAHTRIAHVRCRSSRAWHGRPQSIEQDNTDYPGYHSTNDRYSYLSVEQSMDITRGMTGLLYDVAGGH